MGALPKTYYTAQEYLTHEREAIEKSEFFDGEIFMMAGASLPHNRINENVSGEFHTFLKGKRCQSFSRDMKLHIPENSLFTYPDLMVVCEKPELLTPETDTLLNPTLLIEILSKTTEDYDRGKKFKLYRQIATFEEYVLIDSQRIWAEVWYKNENQLWTLTQETDDLSAVLYLHSLQFSLPLTDVYAGTAEILA